MNSFNYFEAVLYDKRTCCQYYKSLLKAKQLLILFEDGGRYDIIFFIPYICITFAVSHIIIIIIKLIFLSDSNIIEIKKRKKRRRKG